MTGGSRPLGPTREGVRQTLRLGVATLASIVLLGASVGEALGTVSSAPGPPGLRRIGAKATTEDRREPLTAWHRRNRDMLKAVKERWLGALRAHDKVLWSDPAPACGELLEALEDPGMEDLLRAPDPVVRMHLGRSMDRLRAAARTCLRGGYFESTYLFRGAARSFLQVRALLGRHGLEP